MKTQAEAANFHPDCFHQFRLSRLGNKNVVDELFERHFSQIMYRSEDAGVTIRMCVQKSAKSVSKLMIVHQPGRESLAELSRANDQGSRSTLAALGAAKHVVSLGIAPAGQRANVDDAGRGDDQARDLLVTGNENKQNQQSRRKSHRLCNRKTFPESAQFARSAVEMLAEARHHNQSDVQHQESHVRLRVCTMDPVAKRRGGVVKYRRHTESRRVDGDCSEADQNNIDGNVGGLAKQSNATPIGSRMSKRAVRTI